MEIGLKIHLEAAEGSVVWWAESDDLPGVSVAADSLPEMRMLLAGVLSDMSAESDEPIVVGSEWLAGNAAASVEVERIALGVSDDEVPMTSSLARSSRQILVSTP